MILVVLLFSDFVVVSLLFLNFSFYFLVEVGFLAHLKLCKPPKNTYFIIIILERIKLWI
jgi:hypothetical protein